MSSPRRIRTHYDNLQVARNASPEVIKGAYKFLCQKWHPDKNPENRDEAVRVLKIINNAYEVLIDPQLRAMHDDWIAREEASYKSEADEPKKSKAIASNARDRAATKQPSDERNYAQSPSEPGEKRNEERATTNFLGRMRIVARNLTLLVAGPWGLLYIPALLASDDFHFNKPVAAMNVIYTWSIVYSVLTMEWRAFDGIDFFGNRELFGGSSLFGNSHILEWSKQGVLSAHEFLRWVILVSARAGWFSAIVLGGLAIKFSSDDRFGPLFFVFSLVGLIVLCMPWVLYKTSCYLFNINSDI